MTKILRIEATALTLALAVALWSLGPDWRLVVVGLLLPDLSIAGYLAGPAIGAKIYNLVHSAILPGLLAALALYLGQDLLLQIALIWGLHITWDRALGYGLKFPEGFKLTHLGPIGK